MRDNLRPTKSVRLIAALAMLIRSFAIPADSCPYPQRGSRERVVLDPRGTQDLVEVQLVVAAPLVNALQVGRQRW